MRVNHRHLRASLICFAIAGIVIALWLQGCSTSPKQFQRTVVLDKVTIHIVDEPARFGPHYPGKQYKKLGGFARLYKNEIWVKGYVDSNGRYVPDYFYLGHELSCLMRAKDSKIKTYFKEAAFGD